MRETGPRGARALRAALLAASVLGLPGCRFAVKADPGEWTVDRALTVIRDVEASQLESVRLQRSDFPFLTGHGLVEYADPIGLPDGGTADWPGAGDADGFEDFCLLRKEAVHNPPVTAGQVAVFAAVAAASVAGGGGVLLFPDDPRRRFQAFYGFRHIAFADIKHVVIARKIYPILFISVILGPWEHDVVLDMKDGTRIVVYEHGARWLNVFPLWLYPAFWFHTPESYEYALAIEYLRARAAGEVDGAARSGE